MKTRQGHAAEMPGKMPGLRAGPTICGSGAWCVYTALLHRNSRRDMRVRIVIDQFDILVLEIEDRAKK